jgi:membrane-associated protein
MLNPETLIEFFGAYALWGVALIVFIETGLLIGFFLPGDSLLFVAGMMVAGGFIHQPLWLVLLVIFIAAVTGDQTGYLIGKTLGRKAFQKEEGIFFSKKNADRAEEFFKKYGGKSVILARFVPIMRTFVPVAAGIGSMKYKTFTLYNIIGALLWGVGLTSIGFIFGNNAFVKEYLEVIIVLIIGISFIPVLLEIYKAKKVVK